MANPSPGNSITLRVEAPSSFTATSELAAAVGAAGAAITALDVTESHHETLVVDVTCNTTDDDHASRVKDALNALDGVTVRNVSDRTFLMHLGGKLEVVPKVALRNRDDLSRAYTPGVARVCLAIAEDPSAARNLTVKRNTIAVVTDGSAVLGLGNIGPAAALPVMEGKAALFKQFANVDAWPVCLDTQDTEEIIKIVKAIAPVYGGVNLEDIAAPRCFEIENRLREELDIPVFHDDQHGTAIVTLAALVNASPRSGSSSRAWAPPAPPSSSCSRPRAPGTSWLPAAPAPSTPASSTTTSTAAGLPPTPTKRDSPEPCTRRSKMQMFSSASAPRT
jgi:malate dehydrogenase (oxaloacetate-decarboxylating)